MVVAAGLVAITSGSCLPADPARELERALETARRGRPARAATWLAWCSLAAGGVERQRMEIARGRLLLQLHRPREAHAVLVDAISPDPRLGTLARYEAARAAFQAGDHDAALAALDAIDSGDPVADLLAPERARLRVEVLAAAGRHGDVLAVVREIDVSGLDASSAATVRWLEIEALAEVGRERDAALAALRFWRERPADRHADAARRLARDLLRRLDLEPPPLPAAEHRAFIRRLQRAGRHTDALAEIDAYRRAHSRGPALDEILALEADSAYAARDNERVVAAVEALARTAPRSRHLPRAMVVAIRSRRRIDDAAGVEAWCDRLLELRPRGRYAFEARYQRATFRSHLALFGDDARQRADRLARAERAFRDLLRRDDDPSRRDDALWKAAWFDIPRGEPRRALAHLAELLRARPDSGYRPAALYWIGKLHDRDGRTAEAVRAWRALLVDHAYTYYGHRAAAQLARIGEPAPPPSSSRRFPRLDPFDRPRGLVWYDLALDLASVGAYDLAADALARQPELASDPSVEWTRIRLRVAGGHSIDAAARLRRVFREFVEGGGIGVPDEFWRTLYPRHHAAAIRREARRYGLDAHLVAALIRNESGFASQAVSGAGAIGLMQLMPATARAVARRIGRAPPRRGDLFDPALNVGLGTAYLAERIREFGGDLPAALASYNAGPEPVRRWREAIRTPDSEEWIERIPYRATRLYVKNILRDVEEYRRIWDRRAPVASPRAALLRPGRRRMTRQVL